MSEGNLEGNICAFARQREDKNVLVVVPRFLIRLLPSIDALPLGKVWENSWMVIPAEVSGNKFHNIFTGETAPVVEREGKRVLPLHTVFSNFPVGMFEALWPRI
jgi:maltooligosyltrehalose synthase